MKATATLDLRDFERGIEATLRATTGKDLGDAAIAGILLIREFIKTNIRLRGLVDTSELLNSWIYELEIATNTKAVAMTGSDRVYARIHEFGGTIKPKSGGALVFQTDDGSWATVGSVTIPARPYVRPAVDENKPEIAGAIIGELQRNVDGVLDG